MRRPAPWVALLPLLLVPCCWLWWWCGGFNPGVQPSRSVQVLLIAASLLPLLWRGEVRLPTAATPMLLALAWQGLAQLWSPIPEPGMLMLVERLGAFAAAFGLLLWLRRRPDGDMPWACGVAGVGILLMTWATSGDLGLTLAIGRDAPLGLANYAVHFALPLIAVAVAHGLRSSPGRASGLAVVGGGLALVFGLGLSLGDPSRGALVCLAGAVAAILVLRAPPRWHAGLLLAGAVLLLAGWIASFTGALDPGAHGWSTAQRIYMWRASSEALAGTQALVGYGPASALAILPEQPSFAGFWLTLPSWASHPHNELFNILLEGGLVLAGILAVALWRTLAPLWRRRDDPLCAALLVGWITAGCGALIESQMHEPSGMLLLVLLAGMSWAQAPEPTERSPLPPWLLAIPALALALCAGRELLGDGGAPVNIEKRASYRCERADPPGRALELERLRRRLGPLDGLDYQLSLAIGRLGHLAESLPPLIAHLHRLPCDGEAIALAMRIRRAGRAPPELQAAEAEARRLAAIWLERVPENARNATRRAALRKALADGGPDPAR